jgi:hypothetical protein
MVDNTIAYKEVSRSLSIMVDNTIAYKEVSRSLSIMVDNTIAYKEVVDLFVGYCIVYH